MRNDGFFTKRIMKEIIECPNCEKLNVETKSFEEVFRYRTSPTRCIQMKVTVPLRTCPDCDFEYTDWEASEIKDNKVKRFVDNNDVHDYRYNSIVIDLDKL